MKTFKTYLIEAPEVTWDISWKRPQWDVISQSDIYFPPSLIKKYFKNPKIISFHNTTINGLEKIRAIQHSRKTISSTTHVKSLTYLMGIFSGDYKDNYQTPEFLCKVNGTLVFPANDDSGSTPDEKGLRGAEIYMFNEKVFNNIKEIFLKFRNTKNKMIGNLRYDIFQSSYMSSNSFLQKNEPKKWKLYIGKLQHQYIKLLDNFLKEHQQEIYETLYSDPHHSKFKNRIYNEFLVSHFEILEILIIGINPERVDLLVEKIDNMPDFKKKMINYDEWLEMMTSEVPQNVRYDITLEKIEQFFNNKE